ncbi:hypothetical protein BGZ92_000380, partial [Podila epicladia]
MTVPKIVRQYLAKAQDVPENDLSRIQQSNTPYFTRGAIRRTTQEPPEKSPEELEKVVKLK